MCTPIRQFKLTNTIFTNHDNSVYIGNLCTTDNPVIMFIFLICTLVLCWANVSHSNVTMKFAHVHHFSSQNVGGDKRYYVPPCPKVGGDMSPVLPLNSVPGYGHFANVLLPFQNAMSLDTHETAETSGVLRSPNLLSNLSQSALNPD